MNQTALGQAMLLHTLWDLAAWLMALGVLGYFYRTKNYLFTNSRLATVQRGYFLALPAGSLIGAYALGSANLWLSGQPTAARSILGGIVGAITAVEIYKSRQKVRGSTGGLIAPALAFGICVGRIGCHLAGLADATYGLPTNLPWAITYADGIPRHPVALYESLTMAALFAALLLLLHRAQDRFLREGFYWFCLVYGLQRFAWEFFKPYAHLLGPFNLFHFVCLGLIVYGGYMLQGTRHAD